MQTSRIPLLALALILGVSLGLAQTISSHQLNITGAGARAAGMGGAFIGVADDATAIVWNPAGLTQLERTEVSIVGRYIFGKTEYSYKDDPSLNQTEEQSHPVFNFGSFAIPFSVGDVKGVFAAAYQRQLDFYHKTATPTSETEETGGADAVSPGVAIGFGSIFSVGLATNIWFGTDEYKYTSLPDRNYTSSYKGTAHGLNFLAGVLVDLDGLRKPIPLKIGACVRTPFDLNFDYGLEFAPPLFDQYPTLDASTTYQMPLMIGVGASFRPWENLTLSVDFETRKFGDRQTITTVKLPGSEVMDTSNISESKSDINQVRAGIEYLIVTRKGVFPIRAGYQTVPTLLANYKYDPAEGAYKTDDQVLGNGFSVGTGFISNSIALDLTYSFIKYEQNANMNGSTTITYTTTEQAVTGSLIVYF
jgi:long-subunit fatty acid transport protein